ncbi:unnamed protein product, partial [Rotaria sp. Silwood1]
RCYGKERCELVSDDWLTTYAADYLYAARLLRLIDQEYPSLNEYDSAWIAGAARPALLKRIIFFNYCITVRRIKINDDILILAGERELWANIDGISPLVKETLMKIYLDKSSIDAISCSESTEDKAARIVEGKSYMLSLAEFAHIKLNQLDPFIEYKSKAECPHDQCCGRVYANYDKTEKLKLTETMMTRDLLRTYPINSSNNIDIIDTLAQKGVRPNTATTSQNAAERLVEQIMAGTYREKKAFSILFCSNNPYIERQTLAAQQQVNEVLKKHNMIDKGYRIKIEGVGYSCSESLNIVHAELGALMAEKWKAAMTDVIHVSQRTPKRDLSSLLFQTRNHSAAVPE